MSGTASVVCLPVTDDPSHGGGPTLGGTESPASPLALERLILVFTLAPDLRLPCSAQRSMLDTP